MSNSDIWPFEFRSGTKSLGGQCCRCLWSLIRRLWFPGCTSSPTVWMETQLMLWCDPSSPKCRNGETSDLPVVLDITHILSASQFQLLTTQLSPVLGLHLYADIKLKLHTWPQAEKRSISLRIHT